MIRKIQTRRASDEDAQSIFTITSKAFEKYLHESKINSKLDALEETISDVLNDISKKTILVAIFHDEIVGSVRLDLDDENGAHITRFGVLPKFSRIGVGKTLMEAVDSEIMRVGVKRAYLFTAHDYHAPMKFYSKHGFKIKSTSSERGYRRSLLVKEYGSK
jgi:ribosomal protein S18 acetylase RimI-like enzyme